MSTSPEQHMASSLSEREALDVALFCTQRSFDPAELTVYLPPVPRISPQRQNPVHCVVPESLAAPVAPIAHVRDAPAPTPLPDDSTPDRYAAVSDAGGSYQLTNLAPGLYEVRRPAPPPPEPAAPQPPPEIPEPATTEHPTEISSPEPTATEHPTEISSPEPSVPTRVELRVEVNTGLAIGSGEKASIGTDILRISGVDSPCLIDLLLLSPPSKGVLLRDGFALTGGDFFTQEDVNTRRISYRHEGDATDAEDFFSFATPEGEILPTRVEIRIVVARRAPRLLGTGTLSGITHGLTVSDILDGQTDAVVACGLAVIGIAGSGVWNRSSDEGRTWRSLDSIGPSQALLLGPSDRLRFTTRESTATVARLTYRAWDLSSHQTGDRVNLDDHESVGGASAFSREATTATFRLEPSLTLARPHVAEPWIVPVTGADLGRGAVAIVRLAGAGIWQYSVGGAAWRECRSVYHGRALLLGGTDRLRFLPSEGASGSVSLTLRSWDGGNRARGSHARLSARANVGGDSGFGGSVQSCHWYLDASESPTQSAGVEGERQ